MDEDRFLVARISPGTMCTWHPDGIKEWDAVTVLDRTTGRKWYGNCHDTEAPFEDVVRGMIRLIGFHSETEVDNG